MSTSLPLHPCLSWVYVKPGLVLLHTLPKTSLAHNHPPVLRILLQLSQLFVPVLVPDFPPVPHEIHSLFPEGSSHCSVPANQAQFNLGSPRGAQTVN